MPLSPKSLKNERSPFLQPGFSRIIKPEATQAIELRLSLQVYAHYLQLHHNQEMTAYILNIDGNEETTYQLRHSFTVPTGDYDMDMLEDWNLYGVPPIELEGSFAEHPNVLNCH